MIRVDEADPVLRRLSALAPPAGVLVQAPGSAHVTLLYAPLRGPNGAAELARRAAPAAARVPPFRLRVAGLGEFPTEARTVAWLGVEDGAGRLEELRAALCASDDDCLPYRFVPHCTVAYGDNVARYDAFREKLVEGAAGATFDVQVDELWIAGFPAGGHPARDLVYRLAVPLDTASVA